MSLIYKPVILIHLSHNDLYVQSLAHLLVPERPIFQRISRGGERD